MKKALIFLSLFLILLFTLSCGQKDTAPSPAPQPEAEVRVESLYNTFSTPQSMENVIAYLLESQIAFVDGTLNFSNVLSFFTKNLDWKHERKNLYTSETLEKLLTKLDLERNPYEMYEGLIEVLKDEALLQETLSFLTSERFLNKDEKGKLQKAIRTSDLKGVHTQIDLIYKNFFHFFDFYMHKKSIWFPSIITLPVLGGFTKEEREALLGTDVKSVIQPSPLRKVVVEFMTTLVQKYFNLEETPKVD